jgi:SAM-dependent MidA family methyltransferase
METQSDQDKSSTLGNLIARRIAESSRLRITFAEFMEMALYHPDLGYYASNATKIGAQGDFFTSPHLGSDFGELLAEQFAQIWESLDFPTPFNLVEMGAGQGLLAKDVLRHLQQHYPQCFASLEYIIVERAGALIDEQQRQLAALADFGSRVRWSSFAELAAESVVGCCFSNELVDALPVHLVETDAGQLREVYVTTGKVEQGEPAFLDIRDELSTPRLAEYFQAIGINLVAPPYPDRYRTEVNLAALDWVSTIASKLKRGYLLTIDYGYTSDRYYNPMRSEGTLQCYYRHRHHSDPYVHVGMQDITAHVDFTTLQKQGERVGLQNLGFTKQGMFLMALGLGDRLATISQSNAQDSQTVLEQLRYRDALHQLVNPMGLGDFGVLIQGKGVDTSLSLRGLHQGF